MSALKFCSKCGARLKYRHTTLPRLLSFCPGCLPRFAHIRLILIATPFLFAAMGFAIGRYATAYEPFYFIGTPVDLPTNRAAPTAVNNSDHLSGGRAPGTLPEQPAISTNAAETICGARTRSGMPCKRKVKGGGYCWQHRPKVATDQLSPNTQ